MTGSLHTLYRVAPRRHPAKTAYAFALFVVVSALSGLLIAALFIPVIGAANRGGEVAVEQLDNLPVSFDPPAQSQRSRILDANGKVVAYLWDENRVYKPLDEIAPAMRQAQVAIEDHRFYEHGPLDLTGTLRAFLRNQAAGGVTQGGSSITQQYVKMVQIEDAKQRGDEAGVKAAQAGTYERKIAELRFAISLERSLSKDQILERYLNIAYYGDGVYGVEAASEHYFGTTAKKLTLTQAAMLAGLVQNPTALSPTVAPDAAIARRNQVLTRMVEVGVVSAAKATKAKQVDFDQQAVTEKRNGCIGSRYPFLCDYVYRTLAQSPSLGADETARVNLINRGGLTITTAIDPATQKIAQKAVNRVVGATDPLISTMNMIQPGTGLIVAMAQSRPGKGTDTRGGETYYNYSVSPAMGGAQGFQAGSTFKAFTAAAALEAGTPLSERIDARRTIDFTGRSFQTCDGTSRVGDFQVSNSTGTNGRMDMNLAAQRSVNTYFVELELATGMCPVTQMAEKLGVQSSTADAPISSYDDKPSFTLGTVEVNPLSMAEAYATFASGGIHCKPIIVDRITGGDGTPYEAPTADCQRVMTADAANAMNALLGGVMTQGTGQRAATSDRRPQAGKTGTIDSNQAVWFVGYTPEVAGAAMISIDNTRAPFIRGRAGYKSSGVKNYRVPSTGVYLSGTGSGDAGEQIWKPVMEKYLADKPSTAFEPAPPSLVTGRPDPVDPGDNPNAQPGQPGDPQFSQPGEQPSETPGRR